MRTAVFRLCGHNSGAADRAVRPIVGAHQTGQLALSKKKLVELDLPRRPAFCHLSGLNLPPAPFSPGPARAFAQQCITAERAKGFVRSMMSRRSAPRRFPRRRLLMAGTAAGIGLGSSTPGATQPRDDDPIEIADFETATIDGRRWDAPIVGGRTVDAVHRSVLLRFPAAAQAIAAGLRKSERRLVKAELVLLYDGYEIVPPDYTCRVGLGRKLWTEDPPNWHVQAWPLRRPWIADKTHGPTFNASVNGRRYWARYGATDTTRDRHPDDLLDPQELSTEATEARFDITRLLASDVLAGDFGERLAALERARLPVAQGRDLRLALSQLGRCL